MRRLHAKHREFGICVGFALAAISAANIASADDGGAKDPTFSLRQLSIDFPQGMPPAERDERIASFAKAIAQIRSCGTAADVAKTLGATVVDNDRISADALPPALREQLMVLEIGRATSLFGKKNEGVRALILCERSVPSP